MRAGGGCQFTFTCDGSLARRAGGHRPGRGRGRSPPRRWPGAPSPASACRPIITPMPSSRPGRRGSTKTAVIGAHNFYRLPGPPGAARRVQRPLCRQRAGAAPGRLSPVPPGRAPRRLRRRWRRPAPAAIRAAAAMPSDIPQDARWAASNLPESTVREEYRQSGQWRDDAPGRGHRRALADPGQPRPPPRRGRARLASPIISRRRSGASAMCRSASAIAERPPRAPRERALIGARARPVAVQAGLGGRRAARQRDRDAVAGEAGDHRRLVADPVDGPARSSAPASHKARRRSPPTRPGAAPPIRSAEQRRFRRSARRAAPRGPPAIRAPRDRQAEIGGAVLLQQQPGIAAVVEMQLDRPGQRLGQRRRRRQRRAQARPRPAAPPISRAAPRSSCLPVARKRASAAISSPSSSRTQRPSIARAARPRSTAAPASSAMRSRAASSRRRDRPGRRLRQRRLDDPAAARPAAAGGSAARRAPPDRARACCSAASASQPRKPPQTRSRSPGAALDQHRHRPAPRQRDRRRRPRRPAADDQRSRSTHSRKGKRRTIRGARRIGQARFGDQRRAIRPRGSRGAIESWPSSRTIRCQPITAAEQGKAVIGEGVRGGCR